MNVLVISENGDQDQFILKPILKAMLQELGVPKVIINMPSRRVKGVEEALEWESIKEVIEEFSWLVDLFLLCVDRDGNENRKKRLNEREKQAAEILAAEKGFFAENAWQEIEVWVLAGHNDLPPKWKWQEIRDEPNPKKLYFIPYAQQRGLLNERSQGRKTLSQEAARHYPRLRQLCPEDIGNLETRLQAWLA